MIGCVGDQFLPGVRESIAAAVDRVRSFEAVELCEVRVQPPITVLPFFGLATMRNRLVLEAERDWFTHLILLDNDVVVYADAIGAMLAAGKPLVVPRYARAFEPSAHLLEPPEASAGWVKWAVFSCLLFDLNACAALLPRPFVDTLSFCEEETTFACWDYLDVRPWLAYDALVKLLRPPTNLWELKAEELFRIKTPGDVPRESIQ